MSQRFEAKLLLTVLCALMVSPFAACSDDDAEPTGDREMRGHLRVVRLRGTPYQMGWQHGELLYDELMQGLEAVMASEYALLLDIAVDSGLLADAYEYSYPDVLEECQGLVDAMAARGPGGWEMDHCLALAWGDELFEHLMGKPLGCSQFVATGQATADGRTIHGRNLDWSTFEVLEELPAIFLREPSGKHPWLAVAFPGNVTPFTAMNAMGLAAASNEADTLNDRDRVGRSHVQMVRQIMQDCDSLQCAEDFILAQDHASAEILVISDGVTGRGAAFEMTASHIGIRTSDATDVVWATNHFVHPDMLDVQPERHPGNSTWNRHLRFGQLLSLDGTDTLYGTLTVEDGIDILRDTYNPVRQVWLDPLEQVDDGSIATNGAFQSVLFIPGDGIVYVALGEVPTPVLEFVGFSIDELLDDPNAVLPNPASYPALSL